MSDAVETIVVADSFPVGKFTIFKYALNKLGRFLLGIEEALVDVPEKIGRQAFSQRINVFVLVHCLGAKIRIFSRTGENCCCGMEKKSYFCNSFFYIHYGHNEADYGVLCGVYPQFR